MRSSALLLCLALIGCTGGSSPDVETENPLAQHQRLWQEADFDSYQYRFQQQCFCVLEQVQPVIIQVRDGRIESVISADEADLTGDSALRWYTVAELFSLIEEAEASDQDPLIVQYDSQYGYPTRIEIGSLAADAGVIYSASELRPL